MTPVTDSKPVLSELHRLYERDAELEQLASVLECVASGTGRLAVVHGHAGIGKSALLQATLEAAERRRLSCFTAHGRESERDFPFALALQLFETYVRTASTGEKRRLFSGPAELARPLFEGGDWRGTVTAEDERLPSLLHGLYGLTVNLAEREPLVLALDDLHWSDEPSLRCLLYLATRLADLPVALVVATGISEPDPPGFLLTELCNGPLACVLRPAPLSDEATKALIERELSFTVDDRFARACGRSTKGNPFLLRELVAALVADGVDAESATPERVSRLVPEAVAQRILVRLGKLSAKAAALASAVAVLGDEVPLRWAAALAGLASDEAVEAADGLARAEILDPSGLALVSLSFVHPIVRAVVYKDRPAGTRARAHSRAARLLLDEHASTEQVAPQLLRAEPGTEPRAAELLREAARKAVERGAPESAVTFLAKALEEPLEPDVRAQLLLELSEAELAVSKLADAERHAVEARGGFSEPSGRAEAERLLGRVLFAAGRYREAGLAFERGLAELGRNLKSEAARELRAAFVSVSTLDASLRRRGLEYLAAIVDEAWPEPTPGERGLLAQLAAQKAIAAGPQEEVQALAERAWGDGALLEAETPEGEGWSVITGALVWCDDLERDLEISELALENAGRRGSSLALATARFCRAWPLLLLGRVEESICDIEAAVAARDEGWERHIGTACWLWACGLIERGDLDGAERALGIMAEREVAERVDYPILLEGRARVRLLRGEPKLALDDFLEAGRRLEETFSVRTPVIAPWRARAAFAAHQLRDDGQAQALADEGLAVAEGTGAPGLIGSALRTQGVVIGGARGLALLQEAVDAFESVTPRLEQVRALIDLGVALRHAGRRESARERLLQASAIARRGGASVLAERARVELAALGARPRKQRLSGIDSLTPSEMRVAELAAQGLMNRQIAQALFVTVKAVEWHLHHVYQKLDIDTRKELPAALAGREELLQARSP